MQPLIATRALRGPFDYRVAPGQKVRVGSLVRVKFSSRRLSGVVVALSQRSELAPERLAELEAVVEPGIGADLVALAEWMADEYCSTPARALALMVAPGAVSGRGERTAVFARLTPAGELELAGGVPSAPGRRPLSAGQRELLAQLARRGPLAAASLRGDSLRRLARRGLVALERGPVPRRPAVHAVGSALGPPPRLTAEQAAALERIERALADGDRAVHLLHGVTGSGKTEVYLGAVGATLAAGRTAIVLVPEIALTPQTLGRFRARFGDVVAVLHSGLSAGERHDEWMRLRRGEARVCIGPRSAVLAPLERIGLIVIDEEHESSYKHEGDPRYDARTVARERARAHGALLLLGSATPRPESALGARRLRLRHRVDGRPLPAVRLLDMRERPSPLHPETAQALADLRRRGGKAIVLVNRRGWSNFLSCRSCGHVWLCPNCDVALVLHRQGAAIACHHCGHAQDVPARCERCSSVTVARHGAGTERIEHELRAVLGGDGFPVLRLDADATTLSARAAVLARFAAAPRGVLVGTQMVAKGHDFPGVSLGVVLDADQTLRFPDFRAEERTFALICQLAGRTGRGSDGGQVLVQTLAPEARSIVHAARHDADGFIAEELLRRRELGYPPYTSLIRVVCAAADEEAARAAAAEIRALLGPLDAAVLGPAPLFRLRGRARWQLVLKARTRRPAIAAVARAVGLVAPAAARAGGAVSVDVDPQ
ncbi:MAG TPA: primosomal protein N' [Solirubrobacteraceae bacterium]|nr:primosomal protein N' [Solirubrobacteraceae bacterium]